MSEDPVYHIKLKRGQVGGYVLLPGDRARVPLIARHLKNPRAFEPNREYLAMTGALGGVQVTVMSSGMGSPAVAIGVEELRTLGVHTIIRVGTTGAVGPGPRLGDAIIAHAAVRSEGTSRAYIDLEFPAVADLDVTVALRDAARAARHRHHVGVVESADAYYAGSFLGAQAEARQERLRKAGLLAIEMEAAALFTVGQLRGFRTGCILALREEFAADGSRRQAGPAFDRGLEAVIKIAVDAVRRLIRHDATHKKTSPRKR
jgi:uridine phosphorylase